MKSPLFIYRNLCLLLIGLFALSVVAPSFANGRTQRIAAVDAHSVVRPVAKILALANMDMELVGEEETEEESEDESQTWLYATTQTLFPIALFYQSVIDYQVVSRDSAIAALPLYLLHHCLRIPSHV